MSSLAFCILVLFALPSCISHTIDASNGHAELNLFSPGRACPHVGLLFSFSVFRPFNYDFSIFALSSKCFVSLFTGCRLRAGCIFQFTSLPFDFNCISISEGREAVPLVFDNLIVERLPLKLSARRALSGRTVWVARSGAIPIFEVPSNNWVTRGIDGIDGIAEKSSQRVSHQFITGAALRAECKLVPLICAGRMARNFDENLPTFLLISPT